MKKFYKIFSLILLVSILVANSLIFASASSDTKYYMGTAVKTGNNNGYSKAKEIDKKDPHYGWRLGRFVVTGYTRTTTDEAGNTVFLKNVGDKVTLSFNLEQDINKLNGDESLSIGADKKGSDLEMGIEDQEFGLGALVVKYTDYQNSTEKPQVYKNYLKGVKAGADIEIQLCEEGDYEIALDYRIKKNPRQIKNVSIVPTYTEYRIFIKFSVRNGNCMVFPFDTVTKSELKNTAVTENGFYLDLAKSRYLNIDIKKEILSTGTDGLVEDTRFNKPAADGEAYTDEGVYVITVKNLYTNQETIKKIYVGTDDVLKAHVTTGLSITEINDMVALGAVIHEDGTIQNRGEVIEAVETPSEDTTDTNIETTIVEKQATVVSKDGGFSFWSLLIGVVIGVASTVLVLKYLDKRNLENNEIKTVGEDNKDTNIKVAESDDKHEEAEE